MRGYCEEKSFFSTISFEDGFITKDKVRNRYHTLSVAENVLQGKGIKTSWLLLSRLDLFSDQI